MLVRSMQKFVRNVGTGFLGLAWAGAGYAVETPPALQKNVILIFADDMGYTMAATGTPGIKTPNLDRMINDGMLFTQAYSAQAVCSPSRGAVLSGTLPDSNGIDILTSNPSITDFPAIAVKPQSPPALNYRSQLHDTIATLPEVLTQHGCFLAITQKLHVEPAWKFPFSKGYNYHNRPEDYGRLIDEVVRDSGGKPFFIMANISSPHRPYDTQLKPNGLLNPDGTAKGIDPAVIEVPPYLPDTPMMRRDLAKYYACVQLTDACMGAIMARLRQNGLLDSTLVIFSSDNGFPYHRAKVSDFPPGLHEPFIVQGKEVPAGTVSDVPVSLIDVMPTFLDYLGVDIPKTVQGRSLMPVLTGATDRVKGRETVYGMANEHYLGRMVTDGQFYFAKRYVRRPGTWARPPMNADLYQPAPWGNESFAATVEARESHPDEYGFLKEIVEGDLAEEALYDLKNDPWGMHNLIDDPEVKPVVARLRASMDQWRQTAGDAEYVQERMKGPWWPERYQQAETLSKEPVGGWVAGGTCTIEPLDGVLAITSLGNDPHISLQEDLALDSGGPFVLLIRMNSAADQKGKVYYNVPGPGRTAPVAIQNDGQWHEYRVPIPVRDLTGLRLDPAEDSGAISVDWIHLENASGKIIQQWDF